MSLVLQNSEWNSKDFLHNSLGLSSPPVFIYVRNLSKNPINSWAIDKSINVHLSFNTEAYTQMYSILCLTICLKIFCHLVVLFWFYDVALNDLRAIVLSLSFSHFVDLEKFVIVFCHTDSVLFQLFLLYFQGYRGDEKFMSFKACMKKELAGKQFGRRKNIQS